MEKRFTTEEDLPKQDLGHVQHTCEALSAAHIDAHHQCWRLIHGELARLAAPEWKFLCISGEKCLQTIWDAIPSEIEGLQYLNLTQDAIWNAARTHEMDRPLTWEEARRVQEGHSKFCILEYKRMSEMSRTNIFQGSNQQLRTNDSYVSLRSTISDALHHQDWKVEQISFVTGSRSVT